MPKRGPGWTEGNPKVCRGMMQDTTCRLEFHHVTEMQGGDLLCKHQRWEAHGHRLQWGRSASTGSWPTAARVGTIPAFCTPKLSAGCMEQRSPEPALAAAAAAAGTSALAAQRGASSTLNKPCFQLFQPPLCSAGVNRCHFRMGCH